MGKHDRDTGGEDQHQFASHRLLPDEILYCLSFNSLGSRPVLATADAFAIVTPVARVNKPGPRNFALNFSVRPSGIAGRSLRQLRFT
jgi:hypothetical protein